MSDSKSLQEKSSVDPEVGVGAVEANDPHFESQRAAVGGWGKVSYYLAKLDAAGLEQRGIERVPESERNDFHLWHNAEVWLAANFVVPTFGIGILGPGLFGLGLGDSIATIIFTNLFSAIFPAFFTTFGPKLGLRQMVGSRYSWGWYGVKIVALLNCIACIGWSAINTISGGQILSAVANENMSNAVGIVIIAIVTLVVGCAGYKWVHIYERYSWIPTTITFIIVLGLSAKNFVELPLETGTTEAGDVLSFIATMWGFTIGWASLASDYNTYMPEDAPVWKVFSWAYVGLITPLILIEMLGAAVMSNAFAGTAYGDAYAANELGGLLGAVVAPVGGFGKFLLVILCFSIVANNIINIYSLGLSAQVIGTWLQTVPRVVYAIIGTAIYIPIAIAGANNFAGSLENFMNVLGYWLAIYTVIYLEEFIIFRGRSYAAYNAAVTWNDRRSHTIGFAAVFAGLCGVAGAVVGMDQTWWVGPIARKIGEFGGDIGFELSFTFAGLVYPPLRMLEVSLLRRSGYNL